MPFRPLRALAARLVCLSVLFLLHAAGAPLPPSPDLKSSRLEAARAKQGGGKPFLLVTRPSGKSTSSSHVQFAGATDPKAAVKVNGAPAAVASSGGFAGLVALKPGVNKIVIEARNAAGTTAKTIEVKRTTAPAYAPLPSTPLRIDDRRPVQPSASAELSAGDVVRVSFYGSAGQSGSFKIGDSPWRPLREKQENKKNTGLYEGSYRIGAADHFDNAAVTVRLAAKGDAKTPKPVEKTAAGKATTIDPRSPRVVEIAQDFTALHTTAAGRARHGNVPAKTQFEVFGRVGGRYKVRLSDDLSAWVDRSDCELLPEGAFAPRGAVDEIATLSSATSTTISLDMKDQAPVLVRERMAPPGLTARIYNAQARLWWMEADWPDSVVSRVEWEQPANDLVEIRADLGCAQPWGWDVRFTGWSMEWLIKGPPVWTPAPEQPLKGLTIIVDAGHGGFDSGAVGATGMKESTVNLAEAKRLAALLRQAGAEVYMPRSDDTFIPLLDRVRFAQKHHGDLFVSIHNNAVDEDADPTQRTGTLMLYYHPHSRPLAEHIYQHLVQLPNHPAGRWLVQEDICVIRDQTQMPAVLVEGLFISYPPEEALLMRGHFLDTLCDAVYKGILEYMATFAPKGGE
ncbi:MAG: N-acetylmuramoyl-L-alanine amidase [Candidatus Sumerlaeota bacterium]|nr:N-acetylmuramoyl-L-alanine amidase [Candidatus Sumerlaeota bacterium]